MNAVAEDTRKVIEFPSAAWFAELGALMKTHRARQEHLGYIDCSVAFTVTDGSADSLARHFRVVFEEFEAVDVAEVDAAGAASADFGLAASGATWRAMIDSIAAGEGRPALTQTLNYLSHMGTPLTLVAADPLKSDLYYRYNQSLQEFVNASHVFHTVYSSAR